MVTILMVVILGIAAFAIDLSGFYFDQRHLQMQADVAALAAATQLAPNLPNCASDTTQAQQTAANYADANGAPSPVTSNGEQGNVSISTSISCGGAQGVYADTTLTNSQPSVFFSGIFGIKPSISVHARVGLQQVTKEGGFHVLPYAIEQSQAVYNNQLVQTVVNAGANAVASIACDGSGPSGTSGSSGGQLMQSLIESGCPVTQVNPGGNTCPATPLNPPSCLWEFSQVQQTYFEAGQIYRFESGQPYPGNPPPCTNPNPIPTNNYSQYLATGTLPPNDPRLLTLYVVPDGSLSNSSGLIPILGYAEFYLEGWDHDPCVGSSDPKPPGARGSGGSIWGYYISMVNPQSPNVQGTGPCNPNPNYAYTYNCTYSLTQ